MLGVMTVRKEELKFREFDRYRGFYCGLCRALAARYGARARWLLSFDTVFAFILLSALEENPPRFKECRCPYYLGKKRGCCVGDIADYAADITVILAYLNIKDDIADSGSLKARTVEKIYRRSFETARERRPHLCEDIKRFLSELSDAERHGETNFDIPADIFGGLLGRIFAYNTKAEAFGYCLGRVIYITDAACDFRSDIKHGRYNPLIRCRMSEIDRLLDMECARCASEYEKLRLCRLTEITDNVIYSGIRLKYELLKQLRGRKQ